MPRYGCAPAILGALLAVACAAGGQPQTPGAGPPSTAPRRQGEAWRDCGPPGAAPAPPAGSLRAVDWCNREYLPGVLGLRAGRGEIHEYMDPVAHDTYIHELANVVYGDVDGDRQEEAVIVVDEQAYAEGHSWAVSHVFVFALRRDKVVEIASTRTAPVDEVAVERGGLLTTHRARGEVCVERWTMQGGALRLDAAARRCSPE